MIVQHGQVYLHEDHVEALKDEEEYVMERYQAVARTLAPKPFSIPREAAAGMIGRCLRQLFRVLKRFKTEGPLPSLRKTVIIIVQEMLTQMLMEKHGFERSVAYAVATDVRRGFTDWF